MKEKVAVELGKRDHQNWLNNLSIFKEYVNTNNCLPTSTTVYKEFNLGSWIRNQIRLINRGEMPDLWLQLLNDVNPYWNGTKEEKEKENKRLMLSFHQKSKVPVGHTPIDEIYDDKDKIFYCISNGVVDYEGLIRNSKVCRYIKYDAIECLSKVIKYIEPKYVHLFCAIKGIDTSDLDSLKEELQKLCVKSREEMIKKMDKMISELTEREQKVIRLRFGLDSDKCLTLQDCTSIFNIEQESIRQIEVKALRKLRHPAHQKVLYSTNTILDDIDMSRTIKAKLYRLDIHTNDQLRELMMTDISEELKESIHCFFYPKYNLIEDDIMNVSIDELDLSVRAYNCIRRYMSFKRNNPNPTIGNLMNLIEDPKEFWNIDYLGRKSAEEIIEKLNDFLGTNMSLPEIPKN